MLRTSRLTAQLARNGQYSHHRVSSYLYLTTQLDANSGHDTAKQPSMALLPFRPSSAALMSTSSPKNAESQAVAHRTIGGIAASRGEVPLPSQERPKGAMQYAL